MSPPTLRHWLGIELVEVSTAEKLSAALGGGGAIFLLVCVSRAFLPLAEALAVVASMGASAVLLFAVPHGPMSQPWPVLVGHLVSALAGVTCARWIPHTGAAAACAVGLAIAAMHGLKCIHPPGGATAFTAVAGGEAIRQLGYGFVLLPVAVNALALLLLAVLINFLLPWRRYPAGMHPEKIVSAPTHEQVLRAVRSLDTFVDISEDDLLRLADAIASERKASTSPIPSRNS